MRYEKQEYEKAFKQYCEERKIIASGQTFKIKLFLERAENSLLIAKHHEEMSSKKGKLHWNYWTITISYYAMLYAAKAAILSKGYEVKNHLAAQIALGHLLVPNKIEKEDLELLGQAHKIFEDEYVVYFDEARTESNTARYAVMKKYTQRRVEEIFANASIFIAKIKMVLS